MALDRKLQKREKHLPFDKAFLAKYAPHTLKAINAKYAKRFRAWEVLIKSISKADMELSYPELKKTYGKKFRDRMHRWMKGSGVPLEEVEKFVLNKENGPVAWIKVKLTRHIVAEWKKIRSSATERSFNFFPVSILVEDKVAVFLVYFPSFEQ